MRCSHDAYARSAGAFPGEWAGRVLLRTMRFDLITIFPEFFTSILGHGVLRRAIAGGVVGVEIHDLRGFAHDRHRTVDDRPFGGGEGMVLKPEPLAEAVESLGVGGKKGRDTGREQVVLLSAQGPRLTQATARELAGLERLVLLCGRYEGVDERVNELLCDRELSVGDYVLSGGELAAAIVVDATARLLPGVLGNEASSEFESFGLADLGAGVGGEGPPVSTHGAGGLLDYPHAASGVWRLGGACSADGGGSRGDPAVAAGEGSGKDVAESAGSAGGGGAERGGSGVSAGAGVGWLSQASHGLRRGTPVFSKSLVSRVTTVIPCTRAVAAMRASWSERGSGM
jgi:tRNA (guanine37-N1)-methyltransferase